MNTKCTETEYLHIPNAYQNSFILISSRHNWREKKKKKKVVPLWLSHAGLPPTTLKRSTVYIIQNSARLKLVEETLSWHCFHMDEIKTFEIPLLWHSLDVMEVTLKPSWEENAALKKRTGLRGKSSLKSTNHICSTCPHEMCPSLQ